MNSELRAAIEMAFQQAEQALAAKEPWRAYPWLERAHILSQRLQCCTYAAIA